MAETHAALAVVYIGTYSIYDANGRARNKSARATQIESLFLLLSLEGVVERINDPNALDLSGLFSDPADPSPNANKR